MFADPKAYYGTAELGSLCLSVAEAKRGRLAADYATMAEMFMEQPSGFAEPVDRLAAIEGEIYAAAQGLSEP